MSSTRSIIQMLDAFSNSSNYCQRIELNTTMGHLYEFKCDYEFMSNPISILPPCVWFAIEEGQCLSSILNDIEKSRISRQGFLSTIQKGNLLNRINYHELQEDIGATQQAQQSFCVSFSVIKDSNNEYLKHISSQLRSCLNHKTNLISQDHLKLGINQKIPSYIYSKYRIFLIFDTKTHHDRIQSIQSCFYPNVRFTIERIKKNKQCLKFVKNEVLKNIQTGQYVNDFGFLSLDSKTRLLMIQKDDPDLHKENLIGVWIISSYPTKRTRKQFGKEDAIWTALMDYYTNPEVQSKVSIIVQNKGFLSYFCFKKDKNKIDSPQFYLFQPIPQTTPKWSFLTKSQFISDWKKPFEIKIDFLNNTIIQQKQYSQLSDQVNQPQQIPKPRTQPIIKQIYPRQISTKPTKASQNAITQNITNTNTNQTQSKIVNKNKQQQQDQKNKIIQQLKIELEKYKIKCVQLETINKILMQEKLMNNNHIMYQQPIMYYGQMPTYHYSMPYSQNSQNYQPQIPPIQNQINLQQQYKSPEQTASQSQNYPSTSPKKLAQLLKPTSSSLKPNQQINTQNEKQNYPLFIFPEIQQQDYTFGPQKTNFEQSQNTETKDKPFYKKYQSYQKQQQVQQNNNLDDDKQQQQQQKYTNTPITSQKPKDTFIKKDIRNISFQDSFIQYHSDHQDQQIKSKIIQQQIIKNKKNQHQINQQKFNISPQFKKISNLNSQNQFQSIISQNKYQKNQQPIKQKDNQYKIIDKWKINQNNNNQLSKSKQIKTKQIQIKSSPSTKQSIKQKDSQKTYPKRISSSNQSQQSQKQKNKKSKCIEKQKIQIKNQYKKPIYNSDDSDDSDEDSKFKQLKQNYLKK